MTRPIQPLALATLCLASLCLAAAPAAQTVTVDHDDSSLATPPDFGYPFYTPGAGSLGQTVRVQYRCPPSFAGLPSQPMLCTRVGLQLSGSATYQDFELRAGSSTVPALTSVWTQNLPDQRLQHDLGGRALAFGATSRWVEFDLAHPFVFTPGQSVVVDLTTKLQSIGQFLGTALTTKPKERLVDDDYQGLPVGPAPRTSGGLKFRLVMEPLGALASYGHGCAGLGGFTPALTASGTARVGTTGFTIDVGNARPQTMTALLLGTARGVGASTPLPQSFGGSCELLAEPDLFTATLFSAGTAAGTGTASLPLAIPTDPGLAGAVLFAQWVQVDDRSASPLGITFSNAGVFSIR